MAIAQGKCLRRCRAPRVAKPSGQETEESAVIESEVKPKKRLISHKLDETFATDELFEELSDGASMGKRGEVIVVAQIIVTLLVLFPPMRLKGFLYLSGVLGVIAGGLTALYSMYVLGRNFTPLVQPRKKGKVVTAGTYQFMRHPIYAGCLLLAIGFSALSYSESRLLLSLLLFVILDVKARKEEVAMIERYGEEYENYARGVSRFFPKLY